MSPLDIITLKLDPGLLLISYCNNNISKACPKVELRFQVFVSKLGYENPLCVVIEMLIVHVLFIYTRFVFCYLFEHQLFHIRAQSSAFYKITVLYGIKVILT